MSGRTNGVFIAVTAFALGVLAVLGLGAVVVYFGVGAQLGAKPKVFGNVKVWAQKPVIQEDADLPNGYEEEHAGELWMTMDDVPFLMISKDKQGHVSGLYLLKEGKVPVVVLEPGGASGKWCNLNYSRGSGTEPKPTGSVLIDIDFDGAFDAKIDLDEGSAVKRRLVRIDGQWETANLSLERREAISSGRLYQFGSTGNWAEIASLPPNER